ncbi:DUF1877 family protein [Ornithinimicrobium sp. W1665]|uniref:DUF1877 family protein n=1 Tax=Ornithinimicrobium sp. W1665 TaxID=3416666 RepID=UPI003CEC9166
MAWHGIHWLLTGSQDSTDDVTCEVIFGGEPVGDDLGHGPARLLDPQRGKRIPAYGDAAGTARTDVDVLRSSG